MWKLETWNKEEYKEFVQYLREIQDKEYREFHSKLLPGIECLIGIRTPIMREIAKEIVKGDYEGFLLQSNACYKNGETYYEQIVVEGMVIGYSSERKIKEIDKIKNYIRQFAPKINNWATCDIFCSGMKVIKKYPDEFLDFILQYVDKTEEFEVRMGIVLLMDYYLKEHYIDLIFLKCDEIHSKDYYVNMAVAWLVSVAFVKYETKTIHYLENNQLSRFTYNKAIQKILESNRVSKKMKDRVRKMKR